MHWHGYHWIGNGAERGNEAERRPSSPDFRTSALPPMRTGDWLAKPPSRIGQTCDSVEAAIEWLSGQYGAVQGTFPHGEGVQLTARLETAAGLLPAGVDVQWGEWLTGGRFVTIGMICCPNRHVPHPCPIGRK
ncbi:hypothetical protein [Nonomuraea ceibae]|uniref:hypothetical protein n=1 Tax=Nonomuraea ceibae TaxID=1935170 RepID=UPI001C5D4C4C|nr:hypothetical protein [Nonomuraea ceibae]